MPRDPMRAALGKKRKADLVEWILERAETCQETRQALMAWATPEVPPGELEPTLRREIKAAWARVRRSRTHYRMAATVAADLEPILEGIEDLLNRGHAQAAERLLSQFIEECQPHANHIDDSYGRLWPVLQRGVALWGRSWANLEDVDVEELARRVKDELLGDVNGLRDFMVRDFAKALGSKGLGALENWLREQLEVSLESADDAYSSTHCMLHLGQVADALGNPDSYLEVMRRCGREDIYALPIGRRFLDAGRPEDALEWLRKAVGTREHFMDEPESASMLCARALVALEREEEAREILWQEFERTLGRDVLSEIESMLGEAESSSLRDRALECAESHRCSSSGAMFLIQKGEPARAASMVLEHPERFSGAAYTSTLHLAESLESGHPWAAWHLYRNLVDDILGNARSRAYSHAAAYLHTMRGLDLPQGMVEQHTEWESTLRSDHGRKRTFWKRV